MGRSCLERWRCKGEDGLGLTANDGESLSFRIEISRSRDLTASIVWFPQTLSGLGIGPSELNHLVSI